MTTINTTFPADYVERVYAGVLGKIIGVYLGRPIEGWTYDKISAEVGEVDHYINEMRDMPLVVTDDDISGTFTFLRALPDHGNSPDLTPEEIGNTWLNYLINERTILWWGGVGNSTEHTAYIRLQQGVPAPASGSMALNGKTIAEQIGAQIFIDGWGMLFPGDPERAIDFARRAGSVSHDGEAIYGAQVIAAMLAQAFVESDLNVLLDKAVSLIPANSTIARVIHDVCAWHAAAPDDWRATLAQIQANYGYDKYGGACHMVPNHALIIMALLYGGDDFRKAQMIVNTSGWDTDCNAANVGAILGVKNGLAGIDGSDYDWRGPVADRLYLSTADGGRAISDAVIETYHVVNTARALAGLDALAPKNGARFHFSLPGSVQGFESTNAGVEVSNTSATGSGGALAIRWTADATAPILAATPTFTPLEAIGMKGYKMVANPTLYSGQQVSASVSAAASNGGPVSVALALTYYGPNDEVLSEVGPAVGLAPGASEILSWQVPDLSGLPVSSIGLQITPEGGSAGEVTLDWLTWSGAPSVTFTRPDGDGEQWREAWVDGVNQFQSRWWDSFRISNNIGTGLISQGTADWQDYTATADVALMLASEGGIAARVGGMRRWYALVLCDDGKVRLIKDREKRSVLVEADFPVELDRYYKMELTVKGNTLTGSIDGKVVLEATDDADPLTAGGVGLVVSDGTISTDAVTVSPVAA
jgi:ADP-ribosylglycohydrolase